MPRDWQETRETQEFDSSDSSLGPEGIRAMQGPREVGGRKPTNYEYANDIYSFKDKSPELHEKYPEGVCFDADGYPDFSPYAKESAEIEMDGNHTTDYDKATEAVGMDRTPKGLTWHHHQDGKTMQLIPTDLHNNVRHTGGVSVIKHRRELKDGS